MMATFTAIKNKSQSNIALRRALDYVKQEKKTLWEGRQLVSGHNCVARSAYDEIIMTKHRYHKNNGRMFYQFVQSFDPKEKVSPEEIHAIGMELAQKLFPQFEVVVATHVDTEHLHNHLIVNSVRFTDGRKLHQNAADLQRQRQVNDDICMAHGLQVLEAPKKYAQEKKIRPGEYRSAVRGESWKFQLMNSIDLCMRRAKTKADFVQEMAQRGYQVRWEATRQCITYTTPNGKKCRDERLHEGKYLKEVMEREFRLREEMLYRRIEGEKFAAGTLPDGRGMGQPAGNTQRAVSLDGGTDRRIEARLFDIGENDFSGGGAYKGGESDPAAAGTERTGWEEERAAAFASAAYISAPAKAGLAVGHTDLGELADNLVQWGRHLEQSFEAPLPAAPVNGHIDRKRRKELQQKRIATGHRSDDHEEQQDISQSM